MPLPDWKLPPGVPRGVWDYTRSRSVADDYDEYHALNPLFDFEESILEQAFGEPPAPAEGLIADLGCGTGRALVPLVRAGWCGLAIDLSDAMLDVVREKAALDGSAIDCVRANLVELTPDLVPDESVDHAMCLFSTLGMIRGRANRLAALGHMRRILRPGGRLVLHVHNLWWNLYDPGGPRWLTRSLLRSAVRRAAPRQGAEAAPNDWELGDKVFPYRGVPNFFLHVFRAGELRRELRDANLAVVRWIPLEIRRRHALRHPWLLPSLRCNGWIVVCERPTQSPSPFRGRG